MVEKSHTTGFWPGLVDPFRNLAERVSEWIAPASEASGVEEGYKIALELPGVAEPDIHISASDGVVTVKGEKKTAREEQGESWFFSERQYGAFSRSFRLPPDADAGKVEAHLKDGVLTIRVPKKAPKQAEAAARIPIRTG